MSAASVISWMLARSPRPSAMSRAAASMSAWRVRAFRRSSRLAGAARSLSPCPLCSPSGADQSLLISCYRTAIACLVAAAGARLAPAVFRNEDG